MSGNEIRRSMPLFPIGIVMQLTELTAQANSILRRASIDFSCKNRWESTGIFFK